MKVTVAGLWHLGLVTAACLARAGHTVSGYDADDELIKALTQGQLPIFEPELDDLIAQGQQNKTLAFTSQAQSIADSEVVWITYDTPVDNNDNADIDFVIDECKKIFPYLSPDTLVIISSQLPVGTARRLQISIANAEQKNIAFACIPENLRLGKAITVFSNPDRVVVGLSDASKQQKIIALLGVFTQRFIWMSLESAEMTKHAINAFLATSVSFINELAVLCEETGADACEVEQGLKSEERIGPKAYLHPGNAIAGGTLARDVQYLTQIAKTINTPAHLLNAINASNQYHQAWLFRKIQKQFNPLTGKTFALLGLTYKAGTNTLRRSFALEICQWLHKAGCKIKAYDPVVTEVPSPFTQMIELQSEMNQALKDIDAVIIYSDWPEFKNITLENLLSHSKIPIIFDPAGIISAIDANDKRVHYFTVGSSKKCN